MKKLLLILVMLLLPSAAFAQTNNQTVKFSIELTLSSADTSRLTDGNVNSYLSLPKNERINIKCGGASALMLKWYKKAVYQITALTAEEEKIFTDKYDNRILNQYIPLEGADQVQIDLPSGGKLSDIFFYKGKTTGKTQIWEAPYKKADILVIAAHPDDEYLYMGATIPYYGKERGLNVTVAWMSHQKRLRQDEALAALWGMGVHHYPEFLGFPDRFSDSYSEGAKYWGEKATLRAIVSLYRKYRPEVVVTHDLKGEYGHGAHRLTAAMALKAAKAAADETQFPESAKLYGTWQIKKLYLHLYKKNKIVMDWRQSLEAFNGKTALYMAKKGYSYHKSQHKHGYYVSDTYEYSCAKFGLAFTTVGPDTEKNDFLEHISAECLSDYVAPVTIAVEPSLKPVLPEPACEPLFPEPTCKPDPEPIKEIKAVESSEPYTVFADSGASAAAAVFFGIIIVDVFIKLKRKKKYFNKS